MFHIILIHSWSRKYANKLTKVLIYVVNLFEEGKKLIQIQNQRRKTAKQGLEG